MRLSTAFDGMAKENQFLKLVAKVQLIITVFLLGLIYNFSDRVPIMVERTSHGLEVVRVLPFERSQADLKLAVQLMIRARFDSQAISPELFLNQKQMLLRDTEQKDLKARGLSQNVLVHEIRFEKEQILVDLDRVISIGEVRSALKARVRVSFEDVSPNELNPYGLLLSYADPVLEKEPGK